MASFGAQFEAARVTNLAVRALESRFRDQVEQAFMGWENGEYSDQSVRWRLEALVRSAYRSAAAVGFAHLAAQAGVPRWKPRRMKVDNLRSPYMEGLLADVRRNLRDYKASTKDVAARVRAVSRIEHSIGVAAARGQTDALLRGADELHQDFGFIVRKVWRANFIDHIPCELCAALDGTEVELRESFPGDNRLKIYGDLKGPPRHPRCMCWLVILIVGLENFDDDLDSPANTPEQETMSTDTVKAMGEGIWSRIVGWLSKLVRTLRRRRD